MGFFNFIETFFFLSLGITFVLILLLVYHFKQRLTALENKSDTVFEIINNIVQELADIRQMQTNAMTFRPSFHIPEMRNLSQHISPSMTPNEVADRIKVSDEDFEDEESEDASDYEDDNDDDEDDDEADEYDDMPELIDESFNQSTVKIINVPVNEAIEADELYPQELEQDNTNSEENDNLEPVELEDQDEQIHVEKLEETESLENNQESDESPKDSKEVYSKMSVSELKALVITKGLSSDPSKKKKNELIKLLESTEN
jgi:hypothetical protein